MKWRNVAITVFVILWTGFFHYQTFRINYLNPMLGWELPKIPLLFPPAGWIMFFKIDPSFGHAEIYGIKGNQPTLIDPHDIFETKAVGYDNIHRNVLSGTLYAQRRRVFGPYLVRKFPQYDRFAVVYVQYRDIIAEPESIQRQLVYTYP